MEVQQFYYDNKIVKKFLYATMLWGIVGMSVGLLWPSCSCFRTLPTVFHG